MTRHESSQEERHPHASLADADLVRSVRRGEKRAFVEIVARHQAMVCGVALGILGDFSASEDAGQEAFLTAWRKFHELREPERLKAWLAQIARNAALGQLRRKRGIEALEEAPSIPDEAPGPDECTASLEEAALVRESLARLPETYRLPLILFYRDGKSVRAAAEALGISEDAFKQRLARGREMLRERIERKVEAVLIRTAPNAIFTMTLAAAIGALAAPATVAGSVLAAASASGASAASASGGSLLTAMSTSKGFLISTVLVATVCIPVGYQLGSPTATPIATTRPIPASTDGPVRQAASNNPESPLFAEWRALHDRYGSDAQAMPRLYEAIASMKDRFRRQAFCAALIAEWVQVDAAGGLPFFLSKGRDKIQRCEFFEEWLARDPQAAVSGLLAGREGWATMARECLKTIATIAPERISEIAERLPKPESFWDREVQEAFGILGERDLDSARRAAEAMAGPSREQALGGVAQVWAKRDFKAALEWAGGLPEGTDRDEIVRAALVGKAMVDPAGALDAIQMVPAGGRYAHSATTTGARVLQEAANTDFELTMAWISAHPGLLGRDDLDGLSRAVTERLNANAAEFLDARVADGSLLGIVPAVDVALLNRGAGQRAAVWDWLNTQPESEAAQALKLEVLRSSAFQDPPLALKLVADLPNTPEGDKQLRELARCLFNGGYALGRFDALYQESPARLRQPLVEAAFNESLAGTTLDDPRKWVARLDLLPDESRPKAVESLSRAWAQQSPEEALSWADSLAPGETQARALAAVTAAWAAKDPRGTAQWLAELPAGPQRDRNAESFVSAAASTDPREAWDWAMQISDSAGQLRAAKETARKVAMRDPATARQWIEAAPLPVESKAQLQKTVEQAIKTGGAGG